jgi:hypothetical protein
MATMRMDGFAGLSNVRKGDSGTAQTFALKVSGKYLRVTADVDAVPTPAPPVPSRRRRRKPTPPSARADDGYSWVPHKSGSTWSRTTSSILLLRQFCDQKSNQNTPNAVEWRGLMSKTFLLVAGLTDLGDFGRYLGPKEGKSKCFQRIREIG